MKPDRFCDRREESCSRKRSFGRAELLTILAVGEDFELLKTRAEVLRKTGANVLCSCGAAAMKFMSEWEFDLVVIGHSVRPLYAQRITELAHRKGSKTQVLLLMPEGGRDHELDGVHADARSPIAPGTMVQSASALLARHQRPRSTHPAPATWTLPVRRNAAQPPARKKPESFPADITARRALIAHYENRKAG
jgi:hypothetical protein